MTNADAQYAPEDSYAIFPYVNTLIVNGLAIQPLYLDPNDQMDWCQHRFFDFCALNKFKQMGLETIGILCNQLIQRSGAVHCLTKQIPLGACGRVR